MVAATLETEDVETANDPYRGLHITIQDLERYLSQPPGDPTFPTAANISPTELIPPDSRLEQLQQQLGLSDFDIDILVIALAPECERSYDRIHAKACSKTSSDAIRSINIIRVYHKGVNYYFSYQPFPHLSLINLSIEKE